MVKILTAEDSTITSIGIPSTSFDDIYTFPLVHDSNHYIIDSDNTKIYKSTDDGETWSLTGSSVPGHIAISYDSKIIVFDMIIDDSVTYTISISSWYSTDDGATWNTWIADTVVKTYYSSIYDFYGTVHFVYEDDSTIYLGISYGLELVTGYIDVWKTTGSSWTQSDSIPTEDYRYLWVQTLGYLQGNVYVSFGDLNTSTIEPLTYKFNIDDEEFTYFHSPDSPTSQYRTWMDFGYIINNNLFVYVFGNGPGAAIVECFNASGEYVNTISDSYAIQPGPFNYFLQEDKDIGILYDSGDDSYVHILHFQNAKQKYLLTKIYNGDDGPSPSYGIINFYDFIIFYDEGGDYHNVVVSIQDIESVVESVNNTLDATLVFNQDNYLSLVSNQTLILYNKHDEVSFIGSVDHEIRQGSQQTITCSGIWNEKYLSGCKLTQERYLPGELLREIIDGTNHMYYDSESDIVDGSIDVDNTVVDGFTIDKIFIWYKNITGAMLYRYPDGRIVTKTSSFVTHTIKQNTNGNYLQLNNSNIAPSSERVSYVRPSKITVYGGYNSSEGRKRISASYEYSDVTQPYHIIEHYPTAKTSEELEEILSTISGRESVDVVELHCTIFGEGVLMLGELIPIDLTSIVAAFPNVGAAQDEYYVKSISKYYLDEADRQEVILSSSVSYTSKYLNTTPTYLQTNSTGNDVQQEVYTISDEMHSGFSVRGTRYSTPYTIGNKESDWIGVGVDTTVTNATIDNHINTIGFSSTVADTIYLYDSLSATSQTVEFWIGRDSSVSADFLITADDSSGNRTWQVIVNTSSIIFYNGTAVSTIPYESDKLYHIRAEFIKNTSLKYYLNGVLIYNGSTAPNYTINRIKIYNPIGGTTYLDAIGLDFNNYTSWSNFKKGYLDTGMITADISHFVEMNAENANIDSRQRYYNDFTVGNSEDDYTSTYSTSTLTNEIYDNHNNALKIVTTGLEHLYVDAASSISFPFRKEFWIAFSPSHPRIDFRFDSGTYLFGLSFETISSQTRVRTLHRDGSTKDYTIHYIEQSSQWTHFVIDADASGNVVFYENGIPIYNTTFTASTTTFTEDRLVIFSSTTLYIDAIGYDFMQYQDWSNLNPGQLRTKGIVINEEPNCLTIPPLLFFSTSGFTEARSYGAALSINYVNTGNTVAKFCIPYSGKYVFRLLFHGSVNSGSTSGTFNIGAWGVNETMSETNKISGTAVTFSAPTANKQYFSLTPIIEFERGQIVAAYFNKTSTTPASGVWYMDALELIKIG